MLRRFFFVGIFFLFFDYMVGFLVFPDKILLSRGWQLRSAARHFNKEIRAWHFLNLFVFFYSWAFFMRIAVFLFRG